jgi:transcriptional regulator with XRE-family HTH domain
LADFLRRRREALRPVDVGLPDGVRRRASGLRREEVAGLVGMSTDYYTRLEQRRGPQPSEQMITAIARALRLSLDERDHLFRLAGHNAPSRLRRSSHVPPGLMQVLDRLDDSPAMIVTDLCETLVQNRLAKALLGDLTAFTGEEASGVYRWFTNPRERQIYPERDRAHQSRIQVADLRAALSLAGDDRAEKLVARLHRLSPEFAGLWDQHEVKLRGLDHKTIVHPELGEIEVDCQKLFTEDRAQMLLVFTGQPGTEGREKLQLLGVVGHQQFAPVDLSGR